MYAKAPITLNYTVTTSCRGARCLNHAAEKTAELMAEAAIIPHTRRGPRDKGTTFRLLMFFHSMEISDFAKTNMTKKTLDSPIFSPNRPNPVEIKAEAEAKGVPRANIVSSRRCIINESFRGPNPLRCGFEVNLTFSRLELLTKSA